VKTNKISFIHGMEWFEISGIVLLSSFKYIFGVGLAMFTYANDPLKGFIITTFGGILGATVWIFWGEIMLMGWNVFRRWIANKFSTNRLNEQGGEIEKIRKFSKQNRFIIKVKQSGGLSVIALLGPVLISLPVACLLLVGFGLDRKSAWRMMAISVLLWGGLIFGLVGFFEININQYFEHIL